MLIRKFCNITQPSVKLTHNIPHIFRPIRRTVFSFWSFRQSWNPNCCLVTMATPSNAEKGKSGVNEKGEYVRKGGQFRDWITADGSSGFKAERGRYHLYVALACPFSHRTLIGRKLKGLEDVIPITVLDYMLDREKGWSFTDQRPKCTLDPIHNAKYIKEIYLKADPEYSSNISVPVLWDKEKNTIVSNESAEILRMFNSEFNEFCATEEQKKLDLYPEPLRAKIDDLNSWIVPSINGGVYTAGFATAQEAYDKAVGKLFETLDKVEGILSKTRYLTGDTITIADAQLFASLIRFDEVYHGHFKCNKKRIVDYPNMWGYLRDMYQYGGLGETTDFEHIKNTYYGCQRHVNPLGIIPVGPGLNYMEPHGREGLGQ